VAAFTTEFTVTTVGVEVGGGGGTGSTLKLTGMVAFPATGPASMTILA
jgi:hypothetical protein